MKKGVAIQAVWVFLAVAGLGYYVVKVLAANLTYFDDAYMFTRYAKHFLAGGGFSWNVADGPSFGITSPAHLFLVTAVLGLTGWADFEVLTRLSFAAGLLALGTLVVLGFLIQRQAGSARRTSWAPLLVIPYLVFLTPLEFHTLSGMETTLALWANGLLAVAVVTAGRRPSAGTLAFCLAAGYFAFAARPDNGIYALLLPPLYLVASDRGAWKWALRYAALFLVVLAGDALLKYQLFGGVLPLAFYAKKSGFYVGYLGANRWNVMITFLTFWIAAAPGIALAIVKAERSRARQLLAVAIPFAATMVYFASVVQIMGFEARYYYPSLAFVVLLASLAAWPEQNPATAPASAEGSPEPSPRARRELLFRLAIAFLAVLPLASDSLKAAAVNWWEKHVIGEIAAIKPMVSYSPTAGEPLPLLRGFLGNMLMSVLVQRLPPGTVIAASEYGFIGSKSPDTTIIDMVGLHDKTIAHHGFSADYVLGRQPDLIWLPHEDYSGAIAQLLDHPRFGRDYELYPRAFSYGIALRKTSPRFAELKIALQKGFDAVYPGKQLADYVSAPLAADAPALTPN